MLRHRCDLRGSCRWSRLISWLVLGTPGCRLPRRTPLTLPGFRGLRPSRYARSFAERHQEITRALCHASAMYRWAKLSEPLNSSSSSTCPLSSFTRPALHGGEVLEITIVVVIKVIIFRERSASAVLQAFSNHRHHQSPLRFAIQHRCCGMQSCSIHNSFFILLEPVSKCPNPHSNPTVPSLA